MRFSQNVKCLGNLCIIHIFDIFSIGGEEICKESSLKFSSLNYYRIGNLINICGFNDLCQHFNS